MEEGERIAKEIEELRSWVRQNPRIGLDTQFEIYEFLEEAVKLLKEEDVLSTHKANALVAAAEKRAHEAERQERLMPWVPMTIAVYFTCVLILIAWLVVKYNLPIFSPGPDPWEVMPGVVLWSTVGSATFGIWNLGIKVAHQQVNLNRMFWYATYPITGAGLGAILFLVVHGGLLALTEEAGSYNPTVLFAVAALAGFWQQHVIQFFRNIIENILRTGREKPEELG